MDDNGSFHRTDYLGQVIQAFTSYNGILTGTIFVNKTGAKLEGATVSSPDFDRKAVSDVHGRFRIERIPVESFSLRVTKRGYTDFEQAEVCFNGERELNIELRMLHPEMALDPQQINAEAVEGRIDNHSIHITNPGDGPLSFNTSIRGNRADGALWDQLAEFNTSQVVNDERVEAVAFFQDYFWIAGGVGHEEPNMLYKLNRDFRLVDIAEQASWSPYGWRDLTCDDSYLYGVDSAYIAQINPNTMEVTGYQIPSPLNSTFAVTYDGDNQLFWVSNALSDIYGIDGNGNTVMQINNERRFHISGLAYFPEDPDGYCLYVLNNMKREDNSGYVRLLKVNIETGDDTFVADLQTEPDERAGGCFITNELFQFTWSFLSQMQAEQDYLHIYEAASDFYWLTINPTEAEVAAGGDMDMDVTLNPEGLELSRTYEAHIQFNHNTPVDDAIWVDVQLTVQPNSAPESETVPTNFGLNGVHPNPFNVRATASYSLNRDGIASLAVYNLAGRELALLANGFQTAGSHQVTIAGEGWASGIYILKLTQGANATAGKFTLLR
jgi:hypothetical protein